MTPKTPLDNDRQLPIAFPGDYVTVAWTAKALSYSRQRILQLLEEGKLTGHQGVNRGWWKIKKQSVIALLQKRQDQEQATEISGDPAPRNDRF